MILCSCYGVSYKEFENYLRNPEDFQDTEMELVSTCCGSCEDETVRLKEKARKEVEDDRHLPIPSEI